MEAGGLNFALMNVRRCLLFSLLLLFGSSAAAQSLPPARTGGVDEPAPRVVMNLAAHPDDEDGLTLAYYRWAEDAVAYSVIYTRGEGGQNEIGPDLYEKLGALRTAETERAGRGLGTQVRFLNFSDFGYSKFAAEAFEKWGGRDSVTARLVYVIRRLKPDVLFTNHDTLTVGDTQHGQHQAVGISAYDAFSLAADAAYHPEQLDEPGVDLWQPKRLFLRLWRGGADTADVKVPVGDLIASRNRSAADIAIAAIAEHRSQGFDTFAPRFRADTTYFALLRSVPGVPPLPENATDLAAGLAPNTHAAAARNLDYLIDSGRITSVLPFAEVVVPGDSVALAGDDVPVYWAHDFTFYDGLTPAPVEVVFGGLVDTVVTVAPGHPIAEPITVLRIPADATPTLPKDVRQYDRFLNSPPIQVAVRVPGQPTGLYAAEHLPLEIAPPLALNVAEAVAVPEARPRLLLRPGSNQLTVTGQNYEPSDDLRLVVEVVSGDRSVTTADQSVRPQTGALQETVRLDLPDSIAPGTYSVYTHGFLDGADIAEELDGVVLPDIAVPAGLRVGFVKSYDDTTEDALRELGATVVPLDSAALAQGRFDGMNTIVVDIRAYLVRSDLRRYNQHLLDWVERGGHLVVNYQKVFEWNPQFDDPFDASRKNPDGFAPYPLLLGRDRVTYEDAPVTLLEPDHVLFHAPNEITADDWADWVQERGLYFPTAYDSRYAELLSMSDPGEDPLMSSTLIARYGKGTYVYTALGWYRQLAAYNPGAYRLFANLVSLPLVDGR